MKIEFLGLPGAGKTYISKKISIDKGIKLIQINNNFEKFFFLFLFIFLHPFLFYKIIFLLKEENSTPFFVYKTKNLLPHVLSIEQKASFFRQDVIIDYGLMQFILSLYERNISYLDLEKYFWQNFFDKRFVYVVYASERCRNIRMINRGRFPRINFIRSNGASYNEWNNILKFNLNCILKFMKRKQIRMQFMKNDC